MRVLAKIFLVIGCSFVAGQAYAEELVFPSDRVTRFVNVRESPDADSPSLAQLEPGESAVLLDDTVSRWREVRLNGIEGFVSKAWTVVRPTPPPLEAELTLHFLSVGSGACTLIECPDGPPIFVECGSDSGTGGDHAISFAEAADYITPILEENPHPPHVVVTHGHTDHFNWIDRLLEDRQPGSVWLGGFLDDYGGDFRGWVDALPGSVPVHTDLPQNWHNDAEPLGDALSCGGAQTYILTVNVGPDSNESARSLMFMVEYGDFTAIIPGDAQGQTEEHALANFSGALKATVLSASHHGAASAGSNSAEWAQATAPEVVIYSSGDKHGHPRCQSVSRYRDSLSTAPGHEIHCNTSSDIADRQHSTSSKAEYLTDTNGTVVVTSDGRSPLRLTCQNGCSSEVSIEH